MWITKQWKNMSLLLETTSIIGNKNKGNWNGKRIMPQFHGGCQMLPSNFDWHESANIEKMLKCLPKQLN